MPESLPTFFQLEIPDDVPTSYGDFANIWHTPDVFVLDFLGLKAPPAPGANVDGVEGMVVPARVVQRVKVPPSQVFEIMRALESQLSAWERERAERPAA